MADLVSFSILYHMCSPILMFIKLYGFVHLDYSRCAHLPTCSLYYMILFILITYYYSLQQHYRCSFPILRNKHFFLIVFQFVDKIINIKDNLMLLEKPRPSYGDCDTLLKALLPNVETLLLKVSTPMWPFKSIRIYVKTEYQDNVNLHHYGIYTIHHMETYYGDLQSWDHGFQKEKKALLRTPRAKYAA
ncbi:hypothetical protein Cgig2_014455 [Carnegiea gigantea]|uniref:Uncharacterized protein n=1 Tax=Carnegiea gigantea TaxID=171969 RepID=A0A9Q1QFY0_9CARY|nr:hypothetical protein Cgig2_014455 [Carnegiea gigantea]